MSTTVKMKKADACFPNTDGLFLVLPVASKVQLATR
jgi:hypothetical protein